MLNVVHYAPQSLEKVLPRGSAKKKPLHEVLTAIVHYLQVRNTFPKDLKAMEINIREPNTLEISKIKVVGLGLVKSNEEGSSLTHWIRNYGRTVANLKLRERSHLNKSWTWEET